jgi:hypothetical protein
MQLIQLDDKISIYRLEKITANKTALTTLTTTLNSTIQPLGDEKTALYGGSFGKMFKIFLDVNKDVKEGDKIKDMDGNLYEVVAGGIENRNDGLIADYLGVIVKKVN